MVIVMMVVLVDCEDVGVCCMFVFVWRCCSMMTIVDDGGEDDAC